MDKKILMKKVNSLPNHYATIDYLTLYRWDKYTQTKDNNWFLVDYDGRQKKISCPELGKVEESIQDQYFKAIDDRSFSMKIQKWAKIDALKSKYKIVDSLSVDSASCQSCPDNSRTRTVYFVNLIF